jgi:glycosyltransferase involved in cell wall biosynthesis
MKICILTPRFPFPEVAGDVLRINNISRYLKTRGHTLILVSFYLKKTKQYQNMTEQLYDKIYYVRHSVLIALINSIVAFLMNKPIQTGYYFSFKYLQTLKKVIALESPDLFISHLLRMVPYLNFLHLQNESIVEMTDALSKTYLIANTMSGLSIKKLIYKIEQRRVSKYEKNTMNQYKKCILVSKEDKDFLETNNKKYNIRSSVYVYSNGINCFSDMSSNYDTCKIVFIGNMRTLQNQNAVKFFVGDIFPLIKEIFPMAVFKIIGAEPPVSIQALSDQKNIIVTGFVESIESEIKDAAVAVAPVIIAAGIQNKVLVAMACGIPVVLTSTIAKAIPGLISGENCIIADEKHNFAENVLSLMQNRNKRNAIAKNGYELMNNSYSWNEKLKGYED